MKDVFVLDSFALMAYFQKEPGSLSVESFIRKAKDEQCLLKLSLINWGEIYYNTARTEGEAIAVDAWTWIEQLPIILVDVDRNLIIQASYLKAKYSVAYGDCFAAALAKREQAPVITGDPEFHKLSKEVSIHWIGHSS